jgi:hypothetical protein
VQGHDSFKDCSQLFSERLSDTFLGKESHDEDVRGEAGREQVDVVGAHVVREGVQLHHLDVIQPVDATHHSYKDGYGQGVGSKAGQS